MSFNKRVFSTPSLKKVDFNEVPLARYFHDLDGEPDFPFTLAQESFIKLQQTVKTQEDLFLFLLEDVIFTSLYATFYETILVTIKDNPDVALQLIDKFAEDAEERERIIAGQAQLHVSFVEQKGYCPGCSSCDNHADVGELIEPYLRGDIDFFINLYLGMQTIQFAMEHLIYDIIPSNPSMINQLSAANILSFRQYIYDFVEERIL